MSTDNKDPFVEIEEIRIANAIKVLRNAVARAQFPPLEEMEYERFLDRLNEALIPDNVGPSPLIPE